VYNAPGISEPRNRMPRLENQSLHRRLAELEGEIRRLRCQLQLSGHTAHDSEVFQQLIDNVHEVLWITDWHQPHRVLYVSKSYEKIWGRSCQSLYDDARTWVQNIHPEDQARVIEAWERDVERYEQEYRIIRDDGSIRWIYDRAFPLFDDKGRIYRVAGISEDVTRRHQAAAELQQAHDELERRVRLRTATLGAANVRLKRQEEALQKVVQATAQVGTALFRAVVEQLATALQVRYAFVSELVDASRSKLRLLSCWQNDRPGPCYTYDARGTPCEEVIHGQSSFHPRSLRERFPNDSWLREHGFESYLAIPLRDSSDFILGHLGVAHTEALADEILAESVLKILAVRVAAELERMRTAREQALLNERLHQSQKLQALGELASGVGHDFNNSLTIMFAGLDEACAALPRDVPAQQALKVVRQAACEAQEVTQSLFLLSHPDAAQKEPVDLGAVFHELAHALRVMLPASIECRLKVSSDPSAWIIGSSAQLRRVIINLVANARDAMPDGGRLQVRLRQATARDRRRCPAAKRGAWVSVIIADSGQGISVEDLRRVYEPFFTTKSRTKGTGLGLAIVHSVVRDHGGCIDINSRPGRGTVVSVLFPVVEAPGAAGARPAAAAQGTGDGELLLVAEDNQQLCQLISLSLRERGFEVFAVGNGRAAMEGFNEYRSRLRALILDVDLPELSGLQCLARIRTEDQSIPVILITGNAPPDLPADPNGRTILLPKPFRMLELANLAHRLIGNAAAPKPTKC
jgi:PAS domain S-box-containing protein